MLRLAIDIVLFLVFLCIWLIGGFHCFFLHPTDGRNKKMALTLVERIAAILSIEKGNDFVKLLPISTFCKDFIVLNE